MKLRCSPCAVEADYYAYLTFLIRHHDELQLPYPYAMMLSFVSSPLLFGQAILIYDEDQEQARHIIGAAGFVYGTGANQYEDRHICQIEVAFLLDTYRSMPLFYRCLQQVVAFMKAGEKGLRLVQFWAHAHDARQKRLFSKFAALPGSTSQTMDNGLALYQIPFHELEVYCGRRGHGRSVEISSEHPLLHR